MSLLIPKLPKPSNATSSSGFSRISTICRDSLKLREVSNPFCDDWDFLCRACWTIDEASGKIRQFPGNDPNYDYLRYLTEIRPNYPIFAVEKSRRMLVSWWLLCLYLKDTLTQPNHANFIGTRKLQGSCYFLGEQRILGVYKRIPEAVWPDKPKLLPRAKMDSGYEVLECPSTGSYIRGVAAGSDQLRQYTASNILADEYAFWEHAEKSWEAMKPTTEGGGHIDLVSTPDLGAYMFDLIRE